MSSSNIFLSLLVALVSVLAFAIPIWKDSLAPKIELPAPVMVEVDDSGHATFIITNGGKQPAVLEYIVVGANKGALSFDLSMLSLDTRIIKEQGISIFKAPLAIENTIESIWELVKIFRATSGCVIQAGVISPEGERKRANVDVSEAGLEEPADMQKCPLKIRKLIIETLEIIDKKPEYVETLCKVVNLHPKDPENPQTGPGCEQYVEND